MSSNALIEREPRSSTVFSALRWSADVYFVSSISKAATMAETYQPSEHVMRRSRITNFVEYEEKYKQTLEDPISFWRDLSKEFYWYTQPDYENMLNYNFDVREGEIYVKWCEGGRTNVCYNILDRVVRNGLGEKVAFLWEGNHPDDYSRINYRKLLDQVCQFANGLRERGFVKGDRIVIFMPMILETIITMLACARIGVVHAIVFAGFSPASLAERLAACEAKAVVCVDGGFRGNKPLCLKRDCDDAIKQCFDKYGHEVQNCIVVKHIDRVTHSGDFPENAINWTEGRDVLWDDLYNDQSSVCTPEWMDAEDPLFMLYTSGSTGKPKGVLHTTAGYMLYAAATFRYVFDYKDKDVYWCTADVGWITGHTYVVYGPMANGATSVLHEGTPFYPENDRYWEIIEKFKVTQFYTAPTAIRSLMKFGQGPLAKHNLTSLRVLGSVGEPINREAWMWYYKHVGGERCSIVDTYWQTETGGHVLTPLPGCCIMKPGAAGYPFFGIEPVLLEEDGKVIEGVGEGYLVFTRPWPGVMRTLYGDHKRFEEVYFAKFPGYYFTGDGARRDEDGLIWVTGRIDDMLNVSGHLMSTAEVEGILTSDYRVAEAAVVARQHPVKGECLYCFITVGQDADFNDTLQADLRSLVREKIGPFAAPDAFHNAPALPKTRSGKILRRILRKIAAGDAIVGDTSTLADPSVVDALFKTAPPNK